MNLKFLAAERVEDNLSLLLSGPVKKSGLLKIIHEKYRPVSSRQKVPNEVKEFHQVMQGLGEQNKDLQPFISKAQEMLNPLKVLYLFERIPDEVRP